MKLINVQTMLSESTLDELKEKTGIYTTKGAIAEAVEHFLTCQHCHDKSFEIKLKEVLVERDSKKNRINFQEFVAQFSWLIFIHLWR